MLETFLLRLAGYFPKRKKCAWCNQNFWAAPIDGGHEDYCSSGCATIQSQIDDWEDDILKTRERMFSERFEHPTDL